ncbi:MAG: alcohol dehydrogenase catalytic domain-containing protein [Clostridiaceae bacterium]|jgi:threonine dehydrogenase-like Zn-dependent dehydrogenase|nr:alcohol dehydrogenase catalytic domain-containing protein [Clostridiaceae bacterium]
MRTAKAAVLTQIHEPFAIRSYPVLPPPPGMARIRMIASGICGTDLHIQRGKIPLRLPAIIGHELVGQVEALAAGPDGTHDIHTGDLVIVTIACPCGACLLCQSGDDANCVNMGVTNGGDPDTAPHFHGGFGEISYAPIANLVRIPDERDARMTAVFACAGPTMLHAFQLASRANIPVRQATVAVVQGLGPVGLFAVMVLARLGVRHVVAVTARTKPGRDALALRSGATEVVALDQVPSEDVARHIRKLSDGLGADIVVESSGNPRSVPQGLQLLRNRGAYLVPGQYSDSGDVAVAPQLITFKALQIIGSSQYAVADIRAYLDFLQKHPDLHDTIRALAAPYRVDDINRAFRDAGAGKNIKTMLVADL